MMRTGCWRGSRVLKVADGSTADCDGIAVRLDEERVGVIEGTSLGIPVEKKWVPLLVYNWGLLWEKSLVLL